MDLEKLMDLWLGQVVVLRLGQSVVLWLGKAMIFFCYVMPCLRLGQAVVLWLSWDGSFVVGSSDGLCYVLA